MTTPRPELVLHVDGGARGNPGPAAAGIVLCERGGKPLAEAGYWLGEMTNNQAEYHALLKGLQAAERFGADKLCIYSDSELMVRQILGQYKVRAAELKPLSEEARDRLGAFGSWKIEHVPRERNRRADELVNRALDSGHDVDESENWSPESGRTAEPSRPGPTPPAIVVVVRRMANGSPCSPACRDGGRFTIEDVLPGGLTLEVAARLIAAVQRLRSPRPGNPAADSGPELKCERCGAIFQVSQQA